MKKILVLLGIIFMMIGCTKHSRYIKPESERPKMRFIPLGKTFIIVPDKSEKEKE